MGESPWKFESSRPHHFLADRDLARALWGCGFSLVWLENVADLFPSQRNGAAIWMCRSRRNGGRMSVGYGPGDGSYHGVRTDTSRHSTRRTPPSRSRNQPSNPITDTVAGQRSAAKALHTVAKAEFDFASGVSDGAYDTAKGSVKAALAFGKNPVSATQNNNLALAGLIDRAIAAEDTPASIQLARAGNRIRHTNPHEIGYITGSVTTGVAIGRVTATAASKISALRQARLPQRLRPAFAPIEYKWAKENLKAARPKTTTMQRLMRGLDTHQRCQERFRAASNDW